ncbi:MAG: transcription termination/antitermination protein NusA [Pelodictyon luteolum]|uniref:Transcription termination/antitermination protein NusA n=1 Tax=Pelodictyon luteolum TaxID=1100 RepID=A0A165L6U1_PELLU|nr:transcription termination factor NusA [Pelodictyon luteolum]KZK73646.1 MAG: transcription termination/antitermination protein NusA [Pelodictyon luteolum]
MARKQVKAEGADRKAQIASAFGEIEQSKIFLDKRVESAAVKMDIADLLKDIIQKQLRKDYDPEVEANIFINPERGDFEVYILKKIVEEVDIAPIEISLEEVRRIDESLEVGDYYEEGPIKLDDYLTRKSIQIIKQSVQKKVRDLERMVVYEECLEKVGEVIAAEVYQVRSNEVIFTYNTSKDHRVELVLPKSEMMKKDNPRRTPRMKLYVKNIERERVKVRLDDGSVEEKEKSDGGMKVIVSRVDDRFLYKLFEQEVPEILDGLIVIKGIARVPGERAKVAVESTSARIDPVGATVGYRGKRIQSIVKELNNENIDVIYYSDEPQVYISRALQPAKIDPLTVHADMKTRKARVMLKPDQIKYAIGKNGNNIHLAEKLTGYEIDVYRDVIDRSMEDPTDIDIIEFREEFGDDMIYQLLDAGLDTAKKALKAGVEEIEQALLGPQRQEEVTVFGKSMRGPAKPRERRISDDEKRYWHKIADTIYRTVKEQFSDEDLEDLFKEPEPLFFDAADRGGEEAAPEVPADPEASGIADAAVDEDEAQAPLSAGEAAPDEE